MHSFHKLGYIVLDDTVPDTKLRQAVFEEVDRERLSEQLAATESWLTGKYSHVFNLVVQRFYYLRQFSPTLLESLSFRQEEASATHLIEAIRLLEEMNEEGKRKLPADAPLGFIPKKLRPLIEQEGVGRMFFSTASMCSSAAWLRGNVTDLAPHYFRFLHENGRYPGSSMTEVHIRFLA
ncbi:MAG: hypothetical protein M3220_07820 [Chloroflexota bacterium]|nr:hypothetical protein [Chloroflexota bacterium]